jgi:serine protease SohB
MDTTDNTAAPVATTKAAKRSIFSWIKGGVSNTYAVVRGGLMLGILASILMAVSSIGGGGSGADMAGPFGWRRVHDGVVMKVERSLARRDNDESSGPAARVHKSVVVVRFNGDTMASGRDYLARQIDEIVFNKNLISEVVLIVSSPGGGVSEYGAVFSELERIREAGLTLTVSVDTMAASGGYMMSLPANKIIAAPTAHVGSVGVVMEMPNVHKLLQAIGVDYVTLTAGTEKRTLTPTGEVTPEAVAKVTEDLRITHEIFLAMVKKYRPQADIDRIKTAHTWLAQTSVDQKLGLVDELGTSAGYLFKLRQNSDIITFGAPAKAFQFADALGLTAMADRMVDRAFEQLLARTH